MLNENNQLLKNLNWTKINNLVPAIIQDSISCKVLMHGYMNKEALLKTQKNGLVTFYSRTKKRLWTKGETSGNFLKVVKIITDCDCDTLLILVSSPKYTCHLKKSSCFDLQQFNKKFFFDLEKIIEDRKKTNVNNSYTSYLYNAGTKRIAQKVGEEAIETILAAMKKDKKELINEASDLIYHLLVLLHNEDLNFNFVLDNLSKRNVK